MIFKEQSCHIGPMKVFEINGVEIWAGSAKDFDGRWDWSFMVRFYDKWPFDFPSSIRSNEEAQALVPPALLKINAPPIVDVKWPDFGYPSLHKSWWLELISYIKTFPKGSRVAFHCEGGHGRTGTALSILLGLVYNVDNPVDYLRTIYCNDAVESTVQIAYIEGILGRRINAKSVLALQREAFDRQRNLSNQKMAEIRADRAKRKLEKKARKQKAADNQDHTGPIHRQVVQTTGSTDATGVAYGDAVGEDFEEDRYAG